MRPVLFLALALLLPAPLLAAAGPCSGCLRPHPCPARLTALQRQVIETSVIVSVNGVQHGSGVVIRHRGKVCVLTAAHVVAEAYCTRLERSLDGDGKETCREVCLVLPVAITARVKGVERKHPARIIRYSLDWGLGIFPDLALLEVKNPQGLRVASLLSERFVDKKTHPGEDVWFCGMGGGLPWNLQRGIVNQRQGDYLLINGGAWFGHSGSGVFVRRRGEYLLAGLAVCLWGNPGSLPRAPTGCESLERICRFLEGVE